MKDNPKCACGHPTDGTPFMWAPGHFSSPVCLCCLRAMWEETLANVKKTLASAESVSTRVQASELGYPGATGALCDLCRQAIGRLDSAMFTHAIRLEQWADDLNFADESDIKAVISELRAEAARLKGGR